MVRNLHPSCDSQEIGKELEENGFKIIEVTQKLKKITKNNKEECIRLPLYMLTFHNSEDINRIFGIQYLNHMKVKIEAMRSNKLIPQCKKCQRYGHTHKFCKRNPTCVKCAENHLTAECTKPRNTPAKCTNCSEAHPANYRGCIVAKELQKRRNNAIKTKRAASQPKIFTSNKVKTDVSFAQITQNSPVEHVPSTSKSEPSMMKMLQDMMKMLDQVNDRLDKIESRNTGAIPKKK